VRQGFIGKEITGMLPGFDSHFAQSAYLIDAEDIAHDVKTTLLEPLDIDLERSHRTLIAC
jgi:hypothetical protein